jgi:hypothetical protein
MPDTIEVTSKPCPSCGGTTKIVVNRDGYLAWSRGDTLIQRAMPELSADDRERLITGFCTPCWDEMFAEPEDDDDDDEVDDGD